MTTRTRKRNLLTSHSLKLTIILKCENWGVPGYRRLCGFVYFKFFLISEKNCKTALACSHVAPAFCFEQQKMGQQSRNTCPLSSFLKTPLFLILLQDRGTFLLGKFMLNKGLVSVLNLLFNIFRTKYRQNAKAIYPCIHCA